jgi:Tfp pilus assembly protein PilX
MKETAVFTKVIDNQRGIALISALLLLLVVSLMAVGVSMDTSMDIRIAGYQKFKARSFGFAESGLMAASDILEDNIHSAGFDAPGDYPHPGAKYVGTIKIKANHGAFYMDANTAFYPPEPVLEMTGDIVADAAVQRLVTQHAKGGAIQMAAGYSSSGKGAASGGTHLAYHVEAVGKDAAESRTELALHFRHVTK